MFLKQWQHKMFIYLPILAAMLKALRCVRKGQKYQIDKTSIYSINTIIRKNYSIKTIHLETKTGQYRSDIHISTFSLVFLFHW